MSLGVIVHGGAWSIPEDQLEPHSEGCREAVLFAWGILQEGGSALDAVEGAISRMEDDPTFNAGKGSSLNADGQVEMDAGIMDGSNLAAGAVAAVHMVRNPIALSRRVLESEHILIAGPGATRFAKEGRRPGLLRGGPGDRTGAGSLAQDAIRIAGLAGGAVRPEGLINGGCGGLRSIRPRGLGYVHRRRPEQTAGTGGGRAADRMRILRR